MVSIPSVIRDPCRNNPRNRRSIRLRGDWLLVKLHQAPVRIAQISRASPVVVLGRDFDSQAKLSELVTGGVDVWHGQGDVVLRWQVARAWSVLLVDEDF